MFVSTLTLIVQKKVISKRAGPQSYFKTVVEGDVYLCYTLPETCKNGHDFNVSMTYNDKETDIFVLYHAL